MTVDLEAFLAGATIDSAVRDLVPDYRVLLIAVDGIEPGAGDQESAALILAAETSARETLARRPVEEVPHVAAWRDAYRLFGAKPQRTRNSLEALLRRAGDGLPRVNRLTDIYNAISVRHQIPIGGEDLAGYVGPPRLIRATGNEEFDTRTSGEVVIEHPDTGEVVWTDPRGVTCRRWNWRQCVRTALTDHTTSVLFILDALDPFGDDQLRAAGDELVGHVVSLGHDVRVVQRILRA